MKNKILFFVAAVLIFSVTAISCTKQFGISGDAPLGTLESYDAWFSEHEYMNNGIDQKENVLDVGDAYVFSAYVKETEMGERTSFTSKAVLIVDDDGTVLAISAVTSGQRADKIRVFMKELWIKLAGQAPNTIDNIIKGATASAMPVYGDTLSNESIRGRWEALTSYQMDRVKIALNDYADIVITDDHLCCKK